MDQVVTSKVYIYTDQGLYAYGLMWPSTFEPVDVEAWLYSDDAMYALAPDHEERYVHFARMMMHLLPQEHLSWHRWTWEMAELWTNNDWWTIWGPSSSGKSKVIGDFCLGDWAISPFDTVNIMFSTTIEMIKERSYKFVCESWNLLPDRFKLEHPVPHEGKLLQAVFRQASPVGLLVQDYNTGNMTGAGIKAVGFKLGESVETIKSQLGRHLKRNRITVDELQGTNPAVLKLYLNAFASGEGKFGGFGNPAGWNEPLGTASEPACGEEGKADLMKMLRELAPVGAPYKTKKFKTKKGECLFLDGFEAPSIREPKKYHFLIQPDHIADAIADEGENSPWVDTFIRGIIPSGTGAEVVLDGDEAKACNVQQAGVLWEDIPKDCIALDLAHSGTDGKIMRHFKIGKVAGRGHVHFVSRTKIPIDSSLLTAKPPVTISRQIAVAVVAKMRALSIPITQVGGDATATQGAALDAIEEEIGESGIQRIGFAGPASDKAVKVGFPKLCKDHYANKSSEMCGLFRELALAFQITGVDSILLAEAGQRKWLPQQKGKSEDESSKMQIDPEKRVNGKSPDDLDTALIATYMARSISGIFPESGGARKVAAAADQTAMVLAEHDRRKGGSKVNDLIGAAFLGKGRAQVHRRPGSSTSWMLPGRARRF